MALEVTPDSWLEEPPGDFDVQALLTVLGNLIDNAIDATAGREPAAVTVHLRGDDGKLVIQVSDTGPGIPQEDLERVFSDGFTTKAARGGPHRGLGLALVQRLVQRLGGTITVSHGPGATFTVVLPERQPAANGVAR